MATRVQNARELPMIPDVEQAGGTGIWGSMRQQVTQQVKADAALAEANRITGDPQRENVGHPATGRLDMWLQTGSAPRPYYRGERFALFHGDAACTLVSFDGLVVDCIVTSPPYYGQRDYGVPSQLGLETQPQLYIRRLVEVFAQARRLLRRGGSLWVIIGDTYWSGKGRPRGDDAKRRYPRFERPQDKISTVPWCVPKQQLLIPHRFAIAMQEDGWIVRNDNVWYKPLPMPDPVNDRCALAHEYVFHFVTQRRYHYDLNAVAIPSQGKTGRKNPPSVWPIPIEPSQKRHVAVYPERLVRLPILATCPPGGLVLDPFCGSGTTLSAALSLGEDRSAIGIDLSTDALSEAVTLLAEK